jgi:hypothetical protein
LHPKVEVKIVDFGAAKPLIDDDSHELGRCALEASVSGFVFRSLCLKHVSCFLTNHDD